MTTEYPASEWLRDITCLDNEPDDGQRVPVHVTHKFLLNGRVFPAKELMVGRYPLNVVAGWSADDQRPDATLVSFVVHDDTVHDPILETDAPGARGPDGPVPKIGPLAVLGPPGTTHPWDRFEDGTGQVWWRIYAFVASLTFGCRVPDAKPEDKVAVS